MPETVLYYDSAFRSSTPGFIARLCLCACPRRLLLLSFPNDPDTTENMMRSFLPTLTPPINLTFIHSRAAMLTC